MFCKGVTAEAWQIMRKSWLSRSSDYLCFCVSAASALHQLVWERFVCPFICLMKHSKTVSAARIRVCLSLGKSASNSGRGVEIQTQECQVCFLPEDHQGSTKILWDWKKKKNNGKPWATPVSVHDLFRERQNCLQDSALGEGWSNFTYSTINSESHNYTSFVCNTRLWNNGVLTSLLD